MTSVPRDHDPMRDKVVVSKRSFESDDRHDVIDSSVSFLNALFSEHVAPDEVSRDALVSYYVDYYLAQVSNGGFSQFVFNSGLSPLLLELIREGLDKMGAPKHRALFEENIALASGIGKESLQEFGASAYFGENATRDQLGANDRRFFALSEEEDLRDKNAAWLRALPNLVVLTIPEMQTEVERRAAAVANRADREAARRAAEPRYVKQIRALCAKAGHELDRVTAGDPRYMDGAEVLKWYFVTDRGSYYMLDSGEEVAMFDEATDERIAVLEVDPDDGI